MTTSGFGSSNLFGDLTSGTASQFPFLDILEGEPGGPEVLFRGTLNRRLGESRTGPGSNVRRFFEGQFSNIFDEYLASLGSTVLGGENNPTQRFATGGTSFLEGLDFTKRFASLPPALRPDSGTQRFRPRTSFFFR